MIEIDRVNTVQLLIDAEHCAKLTESDRGFCARLYLDMRSMGARPQLGNRHIVVLERVSIEVLEAVSE
jgi:hypothetical protein